MPHPFLSDEWFAALDTLSAAAPAPPPVLNGLVLKFEITDGDVVLHMVDGRLHKGSVENPVATVRFDAALARKVIVDADDNAAMRGMMTGQMTVEGNPMRLSALQQASADPDYAVFQKQMQEITA